MNVLETIKKYDLYGFVRDYQNQYGNVCDCTAKNLDKFFDFEVKSINIHFPTNQVTITVIEEVK